MHSAFRKQAYNVTRPLNAKQARFHKEILAHYWQAISMLLPDHFIYKAEESV